MMQTMREAERQFRVEFFLRAVIEASGNVSRAADSIEVHRNTIWRALSAAGYTSRQLHRLANKKPVRSEVAAISVRRSA
jgi:DNA-binding phage protein